MQSHSFFSPSLFISVLSEIKLKSILFSPKTLPSLKQLIFLFPEYFPNTIAFILQQYFLLYNVITKQQSRHKLPSFSKKQIQVFPYRSGFVIHQNLPSKLFKISLSHTKGQITSTCQQLNYNKYGSYDYLPLYCPISQQLIIFIADKVLLIAAHMPEQTTYAWDCGKSKGLKTCYYQAGFVQPWIMVGKVKSHNMVLLNLWNVLNNEDIYVEMDTMVSKVLVFDQEKLIVIRKGEKSVDVQMLRKNNQDQNEKWEDIDNLISFPIKTTEVQIKLINYEHNLLQIQTKDEFILFDYILKQIKWSTKVLNKQYHKQFEEVKAKTNDLKFMVLESKGKMYLHKFVEKKNLYRDIYQKSHIKKLYGMKGIDKVIKLLE